MDENSEGQKDLLGDPWQQPRDNRGRRKLRFAPEVYEKVEHLRGLGMSVAEIATSMEISEPSLRKYFLRELRAAEAKTKAALLDALMKKAMSGNPSAISKALARLDEGAALAKPTAPSREKANPVRAEPLGKKAAADAEAHVAHRGTEWGDVLKH